MNDYIFFYEDGTPVKSSKIRAYYQLENGMEHDLQDFITFGLKKTGNELKPMVFTPELLDLLYYENTKKKCEKVKEKIAALKKERDFLIKLKAGQKPKIDALRRGTLEEMCRWFRGLKDSLLEERQSHEEKEITVVGLNDAEFHVDHAKRSIGVLTEVLDSIDSFESFLYLIFKPNPFYPNIEKRLKPYREKIDSMLSSLNRENVLLECQKSFFQDVIKRNKPEKLSEETLSKCIFNTSNLFKMFSFLDMMDSIGINWEQIDSFRADDLKVKSLRRLKGV